MTVTGLLPSYVLVRRRKTISSPSFFNLILYPIMPTIGGILQQFVYGTNLFWAATVIAVFLAFINVQNRQIDSDYLTGDQALMEMARILHTSVRKTDFVARYGGDEFIIILDTGSGAVVDEVIDRIYATMKAANSAEKTYTLSASRGKAIFDLERDRNIDIFIQRLDGLMYEDKTRFAVSI